MKIDNYNKKKLFNFQIQLFGGKNEIVIEDGN